MDSCQATKEVYSRLKNLDPENASKIIGFLLLQDHGEKEMIRLAFGSETLLHSVILKVRNKLGILSNTSSTPSAPSPRPPFPFSRSLSQQNSSPRIINGISNVPPSLIIPNPSSSWPSSSNFSNFQHPEDLISPGNYSNNSGPPSSNGLLNVGIGFSPSAMNSPAQPIFNRGGGGDGEAILMDDLHLQEQLSFLNDGSHPLGPQGPDFFYPDQAAMVGSPSKMEVLEQCQELFRSNSAHQHRLARASQLVGGSSNFPYSPNKCMNLLQHQKNISPRAAALMMEEEMNRFERNQNELSMDMEIVNPASRQIYLTFPADCTFKEEDVSNYFSIYGPVEDVRIPYQHRRMFGFVTFVYPETVKLILAKGNPHFVCDSRVLVKPYKEKGNVPDNFRKQQMQMERDEYLSCGTPTSFDSRDPLDIQTGPRMIYNTHQDMLWRRKLEEQANLQHAIELQNRRMMNLQLLDLKRNHHHIALSAGAAIPSPSHSPCFLGHSSFFHSNCGRSSPEEDAELSRLGMPVIVSVEDDDHQTVNSFEKESENKKESSHFLVEEEDGMSSNNDYGRCKSGPHTGESDVQESMENNLPDSQFAVPEASVGEGTAFSTDADEVDKKCKGSIAVSGSLGINNLIASSLLPATS